MKLKNMRKRFCDDTEGNISLMYATVFMATFIALGAAIDMSLIYNGHSRLQNWSDAAALAALNFDGDMSEKEAYFIEYINLLAQASGETDLAIATQRVEIEESEDRLSLKAKVFMDHELMFLNNFQDFDTIRVDTTAQLGVSDIEIALVIDVSSSMDGARLAEAKRSSTLFIDQVLGDESLDGRIAISYVPFGGTVRLPADMRFMLETPAEGFESYSENWIGGEWNHCFEFDVEDVREGFSPYESYRVIPDFWSWKDTYPWCPLAGNELVPLTNDKEILRAKIDTLSLSDGTGSDHGIAWGYETLNHEWKDKFPSGLRNTPARNNSNVRKIMVFMTDGGITAQHYVRDRDKTGEPPFNSKRKDRISVGNAKVNFISICDKAKEKGIELYTIGYNISNNKHLQPLKRCASSELHFVDAATGDLDNIFQGIADSISPLRISN